LKVLITTIPFADKDKRPLKWLTKAGVDYVINPLGRKLKEKDLVNLVTNVDIIIAGTEPITEYVMMQAANLKLIIRVGIGLDSVDLAAARRRGIQVSYTPDAPSAAVAELTIGLMLALLRSVHVCNTRMHQGEWYRYFGRRLSEITIGIIGVGRIGRRVIQHLSGFDCSRILINDTDQTIQLPVHPTCKIEQVSKKFIYQEGDIISLHVPLTEKTRNLISLSQLEMMKPDALIINTARGAIVNEDDLFNVLEAGRLGGVATDVYMEEPYNGKLTSVERCLLTAHLGSMSVDCRSRMEREATEEAIRFIAGQDLKLVVPDEEYENSRMLL
jgi:D-3-phosphoglycerate dehydrogenase